MDLSNNDLDFWLSEQDTTKFPHYGRINYYNKYINLKEYLDKNIHPHIVSVAARHDLHRDIYLTNHGTEHIETVIKRISQLLNVNNFNLSPYESYLLLVAAQLHDSGHIKRGREKHEHFSREVIEDIASRISEDTVERKMIWDIAEAHGGRKADGSKDKIESLLVQDILLNFPVRPQMLAALLRFSDELADDYSRTNPYLLQNNTFGKSSEVFHYYSSVLSTVYIDQIGHEVRLKFTLDKRHISRKFGKPGKDGTIEVYLIDEIYERIYKMYLECIYCMRFIPAEIKILTIIAKIEFIETSSFQAFRDPLSIKLTEKGYPKLIEEDLFELCPADLYENSLKLDGEYLNNKLI